MTICIYCLKQKTINHFSNREHVIPQSFGCFHPENFILNRRDKRTKYVCNSCNKLFGDTLDFYLSKDSFEGYICRNKHLKFVNSSNRTRITIKIYEGKYKGLNVEFNKHSVEAVPQIALLNNKNVWEYFLPTKVNNIIIANFQLTPKSIIAYNLSEEEAKVLLSKVGINFQPDSVLPKPSETDLLCEVQTKIDKSIRRAVSKIAFNYFSYFNIKCTTLNSNFNIIRKFIFTGEGNPPINISNAPILADEHVLKRLGHIVAIEKNLHNMILAHVTLYNEIKYTIFLGKSDGVKNLKVGFGHFFCCNTNKIHPIIGTSNIIIPEIKIYIPNNKIWLPDTAKKAS